MFLGFGELVKEFALEFLSEDLKKNQENAKAIAELLARSEESNYNQEDNTNASNNSSQ